MSYDCWKRMNSVAGYPSGTVMCVDDSEGFG